MLGRLMLMGIRSPTHWRGGTRLLFEVAPDGSVRFKRVVDPVGTGPSEGGNTYELVVVAEDGNGGSATQLLTVNVVKGASSINSYDSLTLDWERGQRT